MTIKRIKVKETKRYWGELEGTLESIISSLQEELDAGWEGIEEESEKYSDCYFPYLYKFREETDKEYEKRLKQLEKEKADKAKAKERKLKQLKKDLANLTEDELKQLGVK